MSTYNIQVTPQNNTLLVIDNDQNQVVVTNPITSVVEVVSQGPQGPRGVSFPYTGSAIISGSLIVTGSIIMSVTGSFVLPLSQSSSPLTGSAYWSGSFLYIYDGTHYRSSSFA